MTNHTNFEAILLSTPYEKEDAYHSLSMPVYNTAAYEFDTAEEMEAAFCGRSAEYTYSRITNPTVQYFEKRILQITGAAGVTALSSGMAAISNALITLAETGKNIVTSPHLFGNTYSLFNGILKRFGVEIRFCDMNNPEEVRKNIDENTCALFLEVITNPHMEVADLKKLSAITKEKNIPLIADTTVVPLHIFKASDYGVDIEIVSGTKYISGGATGISGIIIDYGVENFTTKLRKEIHRNLGAYMSPQVAYMQTLGLETMEVRYNRQAETCLELAKRLTQLKEIQAVKYPGLEEDEYYKISSEQFGKYPGAMFTFNLSSREECFKFLNRLKLIRRATNLFDNKTLAIHPASTIYGNFTEQQRTESGIDQRTIRISIGLEDVDSLFEDIRQALQ